MQQMPMSTRHRQSVQINEQSVLPVKHQEQTQIQTDMTHLLWQCVRKCCGSAGVCEKLVMLGAFRTNPDEPCRIQNSQYTTLFQKSLLKQQWQSPNISDLQSSLQWMTVQSVVEVNRVIFECFHDIKSELAQNNRLSSKQLFQEEEHILLIFFFYLQDKLIYSVIYRFSSHSCHYKPTLLE